jgi:threonine dehydrogenase-like Zn-dependent dehydrogenase
MMKAAVLHGNADLRVEDIAVPEVGEGEVLVRVAYSGVCGSDVPRLIHNGAHFYPIVLGHEFSGEIVEVGAGVDKALTGTKVACAPLVPMFEHPQSQRGNFALGKGYSFIGSRRQGGFAEYVTMPLVNAVPLADSVDMLAGAFMEPLTVGLHAINIMNFQPGRTTAVIGLGTIGMLLMQCAKLLGAGPISAFDVDPGKLELARKYGADVTVNSTDETAVKEAIAAGGYEMVFETAGVPAAEILALRLAAGKGRVMYVGTPHVPLTLQPDEFEEINRKELTIQGSWMNYSAPFPGWEWTFGAEALGNNRIRLDGLIDRVLPLDAAGDIPGLLRAGAVRGKVMLKMGA